MPLIGYCSLSVSSLSLDRQTDDCSQSLNKRWSRGLIPVLHVLHISASSSSRQTVFPDLSVVVRRSGSWDDTRFSSENVNTTVKTQNSLRFPGTVCNNRSRAVVPDVQMSPVVSYSSAVSPVKRFRAPASRAARCLSCRTLSASSNTPVTDGFLRTEKCNELIEMPYRRAETVRRPYPCEHPGSVPKAR